MKKSLKKDITSSSSYICGAMNVTETRKMVQAFHLQNVEKKMKVTRGQKDTIGHFIVVHLVVKPLIWREAEVDHVLIETGI